MTEKNNWLTDYIAQRQVMGNVRSVKKLINHTKSSVNDLFMHLNRLQEKSELTYVVLDKIVGDRYIFLTSAKGYNTHQLLLPPITDETVDKDWAKQVYPLVMIHFAGAFNTQEEKDWRNTTLPTYRDAWFNGPLAERAKQDGIGVVLPYTGLHQAIDAKIERAKEVLQAVFGMDPEDDDEWQVQGFEMGEGIAQGLYEAGVNTAGNIQGRKPKKRTMFIMDNISVEPGAYLGCMDVDTVSPDDLRI